MRKVQVVVLVSAVGLALWARQQTSEKPKPVQVRVRGSHVNFREDIPSSLNDPNIVRHTERRETFIAVAGGYGPSRNPDQDGEWFHLNNLASEEEGWVAGDYVEPINPADTPLLKQLLSTGSKPESLWSSPRLAPAANLLSIVASTFTMLSILSPKIFRRKIRPTNRSSALPANVVPFETHPAKERSTVVFGNSGGVPWLYKPKTRNQGGGTKSA